MPRITSLLSALLATGAFAASAQESFTASPRTESLLVPAEPAQIQPTVPLDAVPTVRQGNFQALDPPIASQPFRGFGQTQSVFPTPSLPAQPSTPRQSFSSSQDPFAQMEQQLREMEAIQQQMFDRMNQSLRSDPFFIAPSNPGQGFATPGFSGHSVTSPGTQMFATRGGGLEDRGDHYAIEVSASGLEQGSVDLTVNGQTLTLAATQNQVSSSNGAHVSFTNHIRQSWTLPADADREAITSQLDRDTLTITIPRQGLQHPTSNTL